MENTIGKKHYLKGKELSELEELLDHFNNLRKTEEIESRLHIVKLEVLVEHCQQEDLREKIIEFGPDSGWITTQSQNVTFKDWSSTSKNDMGFILNGEFSKPGHSMHIRQSSHGWSVTYYIEGRGDEMIAEDLTFLSVLSEEESLLYRNYWTIQEGTAQQFGFGCRISYSRFAGLKKTGG